MFGLFLLVCSLSLSCAHAHQSAWELFYADHFGSIVNSAENCVLSWKSFAEPISTNQLVTLPNTENGIMYSTTLSCPLGSTVATISSVQRSLKGSGFHREIVSNIELKLNNTDSEAMCVVAVVDVLSSSLFVDAYQVRI